MAAFDGSHPALANYLPLHAALGELCVRIGDQARAAEHFSRALELPATMPEKQFLLKKLAILRPHG